MRYYPFRFSLDYVDFDTVKPREERLRIAHCLCRVTRESRDYWRDSEPNHLFPSVVAHRTHSFEPVYLQASLRHTMKPHYFGNGSGRDSYIHLDNGGLQKPSYITATYNYRAPMVFRNEQRKRTRIQLPVIDYKRKMMSRCVINMEEEKTWVYVTLEGVILSLWFSHATRASWTSPWCITNTPYVSKFALYVPHRCNGSHRFTPFPMSVFKYSLWWCWHPDSVSRPPVFTLSIRGIYLYVWSCITWRS